MVIETYYRKRYKKSLNQMDQCYQKVAAEQDNMITGAQSPFLGRHHHVPPPDHHTFLLKDDTDKSRMQEYLKVGNMYEIDHIHLPPRTPVQLKSIRVAMVCEKTELSVAVRFPSMESLRAYFSYSTRVTHPALDEKFVMGLTLAAKVLIRIVPTEIFLEQKNFESFWLLSPSNFDYNASVPVQESGSSLSDQLKINGMVRWGVRRQVKYLGKHKESGATDTNGQNTSSSFASGFEDVQMELGGVFYKKESQNGDDDIGVVNGEDKEQDEEDDYKDEHEEENGDDHEDEDEDEDDEEEEVKVKETNKNLKRKRYDFRNISSMKKPTKVKLEKKKQKQKQKNQTKRNKSTKSRFKETIILRNPKDRWSAERYKLAEQNLLEVMKAKGATTEKPILRPQLRAEARKKIGDTGLLDHLLKHMAGKLAPGGQDRFRRRHNADGAMEYWLESPDLVKVRMDAGVTDPYWVPPPGWQLGDSPTQDPICARELKLLRDDIAKIKRDHLDLMATKIQLEEEVGKLRRELNELATKRAEEEKQAIIVKSNPSGISQQLDQLVTSLMVSSKSGLEKLPVPLEKYKEQLMIISDFVKEVEEKIGTLKSKMEEISTLDSALNVPTQSPADKQEKQTPTKEPKYKQQEVQALIAASETDNTAAEEKAAKIQRLKSGFRICKPHGTFLWPNMVKDTSNKIMVQVEVPTPPSVSSSTAHNHHHRRRTSPVKPLPERRAVTVKVSSVSQGPSFEDGANISPLIMEHSPTARAMMGFGPNQQNTCCLSSSGSSGLNCEVGNWLALSNPKSASDESIHG